MLIVNLIKWSFQTIRHRITFGFIRLLIGIIINSRWWVYFVEDLLEWPLKDTVLWTVLLNFINLKGLAWWTLCHQLRRALNCVSFTGASLSVSKYWAIEPVQAIFNDRSCTVVEEILLWNALLTNVIKVVSSWRFLQS